MMPVMDGFEVCAILRSNPRTAQVPIIMLSAKTNHYYVQRGLGAGATKYITKPVSQETLLYHVNELLLIQTS